MLRRTYVTASSLLLTLAACSGPHPISHQELQTKFRASISLASETELFLSHLDGHTYSSPFIRGHLSYLQKQSSEIESDLANASVETTDVPSFAALKESIADLTHTLTALPSQLSSASAPTSSIHHLQSIQKHLQADMPQ